MSNTDQQISSVLVVGAGTAGLISALMLKRFNPHLDITVVYSPRIGHIMVGEGTFGSTPKMIHEDLGLDQDEFYRTVQPTPKLGVRFVWGPRPEFQYPFEPSLTESLGGGTATPLAYAYDMEDMSKPLAGHSYATALMLAGRIHTLNDAKTARLKKSQAAYHLENAAFVECLEAHCRKAGIEMIAAEISGAERGPEGIARVHCEDGRSFTADLYIDASGFGGALIHRTLEEPHETFTDQLFCDRAIVAGWQRGEDEPLRPYTTADTMDAGWCWKIEHRDIINRGYVYASAFLDDEAAEAEFRRANPRAGKARIVPFESRRVRRSWVGNVVAIGNANGFVEPLEATNIQVICAHARRLAQCVSMTGHLLEPQRDYYNTYTERMWTVIRDFLALHYKFNSKRDTPFWRHAQADTALKTAQDAVDYYREVGPDPIGMGDLLQRGDLFGANGYIVMLLGMGVPYRQRRPLSAQDRAKLQLRYMAHAQAAANSAAPADVPPSSWMKTFKN